MIFLKTFRVKMLLNSLLILNLIFLMKLDACMNLYKLKLFLYVEINKF